MSRNLIEYHPRVGYHYIPGLRARVRHEGGGYLVRVNELGFRCEHEVRREKGPDEFRILLFGDSFTAGDGVSNAFRFGDLLEARFPGLQVYNFGLPGSGTDQQYLAYDEFAADLERDLVVLCPYSDNIRRNVASYRLTQTSTDGRLVFRAKPWFELDDGRLELHHSPVPRKPIELADVDLGEVPRAWLPDAWHHRSANGASHVDLRAVLRRLLDRVDERIPGLRCRIQRLRGLRWPVQYEDPGDPDWLLMRAILARWIGEAGGATLLFPMPNSQHIQGCCVADNFRRRFRELAESSGCGYADCLPDFWALPAHERRAVRFPTDDHPNKRGHEVLAGTLARAVAPHYDAWQRGRA